MKETKRINLFEKYLTIWVLICMVVGVLIGHYLGFIPEFLERFTYAEISIPIAILIWLMIYPMMLKVDFTSLRNVRKEPKGLYLTWVVNWLVKPFTMFLIAALFFLFVFSRLIEDDLARQYLAGAVILGAAPCTAMVFVWSHLTKGNPAYTVVQVATNNLLLLVLFTPIVALLIRFTGVLETVGVPLPWDTLLISVFLFVVIPLAAGAFTRTRVMRRRGETYFNESFLPKFKHVTIIGLLLTLVLIFSFQAGIIIQNPLHIVLIGIPLIIQTFFIFFIAYLGAKKLRLQHNVAAPAGMIGASNFFELAVAVAIAIFGAASPVALATTVGIIVEVPVMLMLVAIANKTRNWFPQEALSPASEKFASVRSE